MLRRILIILLGLVTMASAHGQTLNLPPPHALGGHCQLLVPCAESGPFAAHVRSLLELRVAPGERDMQAGGHLGLSFSFWEWGEGGISLYGLHGDAGWAQGPVTAWGRLSPPFLSWVREDDVAALRLALQVEYAAAYPPFDGQGTLFPTTHTYLAVADAQAWRLRASLSAGAQLADGAGPGYRGVQAGAGVWLRVDGPGLQFGGEVLGRAGREAGSWRSEWTAALSLRMFDEGHQVKGGFSLPGGGGASILVGYGFSCGPSYAAATCLRGVGRSLFERTQDHVGAAILSSWRARQVAEQYAAAHPAPLGRWITAAALEPPPAAECPPFEAKFRVYPCRRSAPYALGAVVPLQVLPPPPVPEAEPATEAERAGESEAEGAPVPREVNPWGSSLLRRPPQGPPRVGAGIRVGPPPEKPLLPPWGTGVPSRYDSIGPAREDGRGPRVEPTPAPQRVTAAPKPATQGPPPAPAAQIQSGAARGGAGPVRQGQQGVKQATQDQLQKGNRVDHEVTFDTPAGRRRTDMVVTEPNGNKFAVEVKTGKSAYTPAQQAKDKALDQLGATPRGANADKAGLKGTVHLKTKVIRLP